MLVAEAHDVDLERGRGGVGREDRDEPVAELVHVEHRRVDDDVGAALQLLEQRALLLDALEQALRVGERVRAARGVEPADQRVVRRLEEQHPGAGAERLLEGIQKDVTALRP